MYCIFLVDSLLDAHWMCCQAEDYLTALQFLYNGFIRALAAKDLMRCLRLVIVRRIGGSMEGGRGPWATNLVPRAFPLKKNFFKGKALGTRLPGQPLIFSPPSQGLDPVLHRFGCQHE